MILKSLLNWKILLFLPLIFSEVQCDIGNRQGSSDGSLTSPVLIPYNTLISGSVDGFYSSYYVYLSPTALTSYTVTLTNITKDVDLYTYSDDSTFGTTTVAVPLTCVSQNPGSTDESCVTSSGSGSAVYIEVYPFGGVASDYSILIQ